MNCAEFREHLHAAIDEGLVDPPADEHAKSCESCRAWAVQMRQIAVSFEELRACSELAPLATETADRRVPAPAGNHGARTWRAWGRIPWWARTAAALALAVTAVFLASERPAVTPPPRITDREGPLLDPLGSSPPAPGRVSLLGSSEERLLAVSSDGSSAGVTVYWLYPRLPDSAGPRT